MAEQRSDVSTALEKKLQRRPSTKEAGHGVDTKLASSLQATAKQLDNAQKKDLVDQNLKSRATPDDIGMINTSVAASIQPTAKTLEHKLRRDSLKQTLSSRPDIVELIDSGILKPYSTRLANSLQCDAGELEHALASQVPRSYLQQIGVLDPYSHHVDDSSIDMEHASALLLRALVYRPSQPHVLEQQGGQQFGYTAHVSASLQDAAKKLDRERKKDKLSSTLSQRAPAHEVMQTQVASMGYSIDPRVSRSLQQSVHELGREMIKDVIRESLKARSASPSPQQQGRRRSASFDAEQLAPSLQAVANALALEQKKNTLRQQLETRPPSTQPLIEGGILRPFAKSLASRLQLNADMLEQQLAVRVDAEQLKALGILEPYKHHVDETSIHAHVENTANRILKMLALKRQRRDYGADAAMHTVAPALQSTAQKLEKQQTKDALSAKLKTRDPTAAMVANSAHVHVAPALQSTVKKLQFAQKQDTVSSTLQTRSSPRDGGQISPAIQSMAKQLASCRRRDSLKSQVLTRPDMQYVMDEGILKPYAQRLARSLQLEADELEQALASQVSREHLVELGILEPYKKHVDSQPLDMEQTSSMLLRALLVSSRRRRRSSSFGFDDTIADSLQQTAKQLDTSQKKDKLSHALKQRSDVDDVMQKQVVSLGYDATVAPSLTQTIKELGRAMIKDKLEQALKTRPSAESVERVGVDVKHASKIQSAMHDLEYAQRRDSVSQNMQQRPSAAEAGVDPQLSRGLSAIAKTLEMGMKTNKTAHCLQNSGVIKRRNTESVLATLDRCIAFLNDST